MSKILTKILLLLVGLCLFGFHNTENIDTYLNELHQAGKLNGNVLIIKNGKTHYKKSFGYADGSKKTVLQEEYRFNIGSIYKEFPAVAIMQLHEKNQLNLEDKISNYITDLPKWAEKVSIKNLLQYSSGLPKIAWNTYFSKGITVTDNHIMQEIKNLKYLEFEPGTDYLYSNHNPILLMKIVENISKTSFTNYLKEHIFTPYGLENTIIIEQYPYKDKTAMAIPFDADFKEDNFKLSVTGLLFSSTVNDMANWFEQLDGFKIINKSAVKFLSETAKKGENIESPLGYCEWKDDIITEHSHHGSSSNYEGIVRRFKQEDITIVILTNQKNGNVREISDTLYELVSSDID
tara:strand:- start:8203 stop:9246 length:1044 start_codon:yes stop_codon:yes gene_type:complete